MKMTKPKSPSLKPENGLATSLISKARLPVVIFGNLRGSLVLAALAAFSVLVMQSQEKAQSSPAKPASRAALSHMTSDQLASYVFEHHGCNSCHTMGQNSKFGFTDRGKEIGKNFEGCVSLLTSMNVIAQMQPVSRNADDKQKVARFQQFGCTTCHQIVPGKLGLTVYGKRMKSLHMACTDVQRILSDK